MQKKRILITGIVSLLGKYLTHALSEKYELFGTYHNLAPNSDVKVDKKNLYFLDITQKDAVSTVIKKCKPHVIVHLAALSNIDYCESHLDEATLVNVLGTQFLIEACTAHPVHFIFISSNAVFSGKTPPYQTTDVTQPVNFYGKTKAEAEKIVRQSHFPWTIVRFTSVFGWPPMGARDNDVSRYTEELKNKTELFLVNDRFFNPVSGEVASESIKQIIEKQRTSIFHVAGRDVISRYIFVKKIKDMLVPQSQTRLHEVSSDFFPHLAPRPHDATLETKSMSELGLVPHTLTEDLKALKEKLHE